jgi:hypothetical protein
VTARNLMAEVRQYIHAPGEFIREFFLWGLSEAIALHKEPFQYQIKSF